MPVNTNTFKQFEQLDVKHFAFSIRESYLFLLSVSNNMGLNYLLTYTLNFNYNVGHFVKMLYNSLVISDCSSGVPHFTVEPHDIATFPGAPFNLTCEAVGPPEPVQVLWWLGGVQEEDFRPSPSVLLVKGNYRLSLVLLAEKCLLCDSLLHSGNLHS